ncbi:MAG: serine/threonine protein phosphatase [Sphingomonas sp.]|uniref:metallophosphoesterase family protein n=1 Tax=Sphingomonas sp. TaxID=28214 RepID=UPI001ACD5CA0|nr:metallophosphoesterase family protein [Sphingomonas sp.]MBN8806922.1 serine/threonine protein phosphatase [Sphingomonas sp.]
MFKRLFTKEQVKPSVPDGIRVYAVGDIHGRADLLEQTLQMIDRDSQDILPAARQIIFLGDYVDRGPASADVIDVLIALRSLWPNVHTLGGNHEELFQLVLEGNDRANQQFAMVGGRETALSYGIDPQAYERSSWDELHQLIINSVPPSHIEFLSQLELSVEIGDYFFVHAGVRPKVALADQEASDLRWIRESFLKSNADFTKMIVHGHSISSDVDFRRNRIGIDTGAYRTGHLTTLILEGTNQRVFQTAGDQG